MTPMIIILSRASQVAKTWGAHCSSSPAASSTFYFGCEHFESRCSWTMDHGLQNIFIKKLWGTIPRDIEVILKSIYQIYQNFHEFFVILYFSQCGWRFARILANETIQRGWNEKWSTCHLRISAKLKSPLRLFCHPTRRLMLRKLRSKLSKKIRQNLLTF